MGYLELNVGEYLDTRYTELKSVSFGVVRSVLQATRI
jgi:hypothetical protein